MSIRSFFLTVFSICLFVSVATAQTRRVVGRVLDARTNLPISAGEVSAGHGVSDLLRPYGVFVLTVQRGDLSLVVKADGYRTARISVPAEQGVVFVELQPEFIPLEQIVVEEVREQQPNIGAGILVGTVSGREITTVPVSGLKRALMGRTAAADVRLNSSVPGGNLHLSVRGVQSILGNSQPIYVIDGVVVSDISIGSGVTSIIGGQLPTAGRIVDINIHDIESVEIVSGVTATTLYGSGAAGGAVVIRTKRGR